MRGLRPRNAIQQSPTILYSLTSSPSRSFPSSPSPSPSLAVETSGIPAVINYTTTSFSFPTNFPFQSYSARFPVPGTTSNFGDITQNLYYSTVIGGKVRKNLCSVLFVVLFGRIVSHFLWKT